MLTPSRWSWMGLGAVMLGAVLWCMLYVNPRKEFLNKVMDCVGEQTSQAAYDLCSKQVAATRK